LAFVGDSTMTSRVVVAAFDTVLPRLDDGCQT